jgi:hypothetical protein
MGTVFLYECKIMKAILKISFQITFFLSIVFSSENSNAQFFKKKKKKDIYECGYVKKKSFLDKVNPMKALKKQLGKSGSKENSNMSNIAISVYYQAHLHPESIINFPTQTPGWQTCGDAVFLGLTNKNGIGVGSTSGTVGFKDAESNVELLTLKPAGWGTYFHGFNEKERGEKIISIIENNGKQITVTVGPAAPLSIKTIDGKAKGEEVTIDGTKDIVIELENGDADPKSSLHVQLVCQLVGTPVILDVIVTKAKNTITVPKEAFKNFEGSPSPFKKINTLIVNRVIETIEKGKFAKDAGALRTISAYMDWAPVTLAGDIAKGSIMTAGFDKSKNTNININLNTKGEYNFTLNKEQPFTSPPIKLMKNVAIASFVVRGNLTDKGISADKKYLQEKWFPELTDNKWQALADKLYQEFSSSLSQEFSLNILPLDQVINTKAYTHTKSIKNRVDRTFAEFGAGRTKRILTTSSVDLWKDLGITFGGDFVSQRLVKELDVDAVIAVTVDLNFDFKTEGLNPVISIVAFAPDVSYKTQAKYFSIKASTTSKPLSEAKKIMKEGKGGAKNWQNLMHQMIKANDFNQGLINALKQLSEEEDKHPVYEKLWKAKL